MNGPTTLILIATMLGGEAADWPVYRHDVRLSGVSSGKGRIVEPIVLREHHLGVPDVRLASHGFHDPWRADLDGDGSFERVLVDGNTIRAVDDAGEHVWAHAVDNTINSGLVRIRRVLPDSKGQQIVVFTSRMDNGAGQGYCFSFEGGVRDGRLQWSTKPLTGQHSPTLVIDDVDADGLLDVVTAPHYRVQIFNAQTGKLKSEVPWQVGRNYGILVTRPNPSRPRKDIFIVCDFVLHVDCIRFQDGQWRHVWGHRYFDPNSPQPRGREKYIKVGPNPIADVDGDGRDEMIYMLLDATDDDHWHLRVRDCETGRVEVDLPDVWLWSIVNLDADPASEIVYTPTDQKRPRTYCDLHIGRLGEREIADIAVINDVRPVLTHAIPPTTAHTIADDGHISLLHSDINGDDRPELYVGRKSDSGRFSDRLQALSISSDGEVTTAWQLARPGHGLNLTHAGGDGAGNFYLKVRDLTTRRWTSFDSAGRVTNSGDLDRVGGFTTTPIAVDLTGDGVNEIVVQTAMNEIAALQVPSLPADPLKTLWSVSGVSMNRQPGYTYNGELCPQAADVTGDGRPEVLFADEDDEGLAALVCVDGHGNRVWRRSFRGCSWGGLQAGVNLWTFGRFTGRQRGQDVYLDIHRRSKGSCEGWVLRGDTGEVVWTRRGLIAVDSAMPFGGGLPAVADMNDDGTDDVVQAFYTIYGAISGDTGQPLTPPRVLNGANAFGSWIAYSSPTIADLTGDGKLDVYLNSASYARGGYAAVKADGEPLWVEFHDNDQGSDGFGPVGDIDGDGRLEVVVPVLNGSLLCLDASDGSHKWRIETPVTGDVSAADVDGDGQLELVFGGRDGQLRAVSGKDGRERWSIAVTGRPIIADVTGDGLVEILAVGADGILRVIGQSD